MSTNKEVHHPPLGWKKAHIMQKSTHNPKFILIGFSIKCVIGATEEGMVGDIARILRWEARDMDKGKSGNPRCFAWQQKSPCPQACPHHCGILTTCAPGTWQEKKEFLKDISEQYVGQVIFGDGENGEIIVWGTLDAEGMPRLDNVFLVRGLKSKQITSKIQEKIIIQI